MYIPTRKEFITDNGLPELIDSFGDCLWDNATQLQAIRLFRELLKRCSDAHVKLNDARYMRLRGIALDIFRTFDVPSEMVVTKNKIVYFRYCNEEMGDDRHVICRRIDNKPSFVYNNTTSNLIKYMGIDDYCVSTILTITPKSRRVCCKYMVVPEGYLWDSGESLEYLSSNKSNEWGGIPKHNIKKITN